MWTRLELKTNAKTVLKTSYWYGVVAFLAVFGITAAAAGIIGRLVPYIAVAVNFFVAYPLAVGLDFFFLQNRNTAELPKIGNIFFPFRNGDRYLKIVGAMAWMVLFTFLWAIIPVAGIVLMVIKGISYSMTPFILTDNPDIGYRRALKLSIAMTEGQKWPIFVLGLSFIGWYALVILTIGIGMFFLTPYVQATNAELYVRLRTEAVEKGLCTREELNLPSPASLPEGPRPDAPGPAPED